MENVPKSGTEFRGEILNGFVGLFFLNGRSASSSDAEQLEKCIVATKKHVINSAHIGAFAVASAELDGSCAGFDAKQNRHIFTDDAYYLFVGAGSIYNRIELINELRCEKPVSDSEIMWFAWQRWKTGAPEHLDGDWMFAVYDMKKEELVIARAWGNTSLYWFTGKDFVAFSTHPNSLRSIDNVSVNIDLDTVARLLLSKKICCYASCWKEIKQIKPGSWVLIKDDKFIENIFWRPMFESPDSVVNEKAALEEFIFLYDNAVKKRLGINTKTGATLSSGLDSSSVCALAARELKNRGEVLKTWTSVPKYINEAYSFSNWNVDESEMVNMFLADSVNISHTYIDASDISPIDSIREQIVKTGKPQGPVANLYWIDKIIMQANKSGHGVLLTGQFGNLSVSYSPPNIQFFPKGRYFPETSWIKYLRFLVKKSKIEIKNKLKKTIGYDEGLNDKSGNFNPEFLNSSIYNDISKNDKLTGMVKHNEIAEVHEGIFDTWYHVGYWQGIEARDPTMDVELIKFMLRLPDETYFKDGVNRRVIRLGTEGILPDVIRLNRKRGQQGGDILPRIRSFPSHALQAMEYIEGSKLAKEILNTNKMNDILARVLDGESSKALFQEFIKMVLSGISTGLFLASLDSGVDLTKQFQ